MSFSSSVSGIGWRDTGQMCYEAKPLKWKLANSNMLGKWLLQKKFYKKIQKMINHRPFNFCIIRKKWLSEFFAYVDISSCLDTSKFYGDISPSIITTNAAWVFYYPPAKRSEARWMFSALSVCQCVCLYTRQLPND